MLWLSADWHCLAVFVWAYCLLATLNPCEKCSRRRNAFFSSFRLPKIASAECAFCISRFQNWTRFGVQKSDPPFQRLLRAFANWDRFRARQAAPISGPSFFSGRDFRDTRDKKKCGCMFVRQYSCLDVQFHRCTAIWVYGCIVA